MKKHNDTKDLEKYLEVHASELVEIDDDLEGFVRSAKKDNDERRVRATYLQSLRRDKLKLSQSELAKAVGANVRTLQGWETGRQDYPMSVEILMTLMKQLPQIKRMLMRVKPEKNGRIKLPVLRGKAALGARTGKVHSTKKTA